jgi:hypothetical protein
MEVVAAVRMDPAQFHLLLVRAVKEEVVVVAVAAVELVVVMEAEVATDS